VARRSYVDPRVVDRFVEGRTIGTSLAHLGDRGAAVDLRHGQGRAKVEAAVLGLLSED